jgi:hypothetical protein
MERRTGNPGRDDKVEIYVHLEAELCGWGNSRDLLFLSFHPISRPLIEVTALHFVIPSELRISYYAALINDHVCGFL